MAVVVFLQVRANMIKVHGLVGDLRTATDLGFFHKNDRVAFTHHVAFCHGDLAHDAVEISSNHMFHFHGLDYRQLLSCPYFFSHHSVDRDDGALNG